MKKKSINSHFNKIAANQKPMTQNTQVTQQSIPSPGLNLNPPASKKSIQNQMAMDKAASQKLKNSQQDKTVRATNQTSLKVKQDFAKAAQVNTQKFNHAAKAQSITR